MKPKILFVLLIASWLGFFGYEKLVKANWQNTANKEAKIDVQPTRKSTLTITPTASLTPEPQVIYVYSTQQPCTWRTNSATGEKICMTDEEMNSRNDLIQQNYNQQRTQNSLDEANRKLQETENCQKEYEEYSDCLKDNQDNMENYKRCMDYAPQMCAQPYQAICSKPLCSL